MADTVLIHNKDRFVFKLPGDRIVLPPGAQEVPADQWEAAIEHEMVASLVSSGSLVVVNGSLSALPLKKALQVVADTYDPVQLEAWVKDRRKAVREKAQANLDEVNKTLAKAKKGEPTAENSDAIVATVTTEKPR